MVREGNGEGRKGVERGGVGKEGSREERGGEALRLPSHPFPPFLLTPPPTPFPPNPLPFPIPPPHPPKEGVGREGGMKGV